VLVDLPSRAIQQPSAASRSSQQLAIGNRNGSAVHGSAWFGCSCSMLICGCCVRLLLLIYVDMNKSSLLAMQRAMEKCR
jgi:hypothetical protein